jgi:hypothetical protein
MALDALQNNATSLTETKGTTSAVRISYPPALLDAFRSLFRAGRTYDFMLHYNTTIASVGGGVLQGYLAWNATSGYGEWTALAALFDEVKLMSSHLSWTTAFGPTSTAIVVQISLAPDFATNGVTPSFTPVTRLAESIEFSIDKPGVAGASTRLKTARCPPGRLYASTASPISSTLDCGCNGQWSFASNIVTTASINIAFAVMRNVMRFRCRA